MKSNLADLDIKNKTVLLRIDANVPIKNGIVLNDQRLVASLPTIHLLLDKGAHIILLTHIGRPKTYDAKLSTKQLILWFDENGLDVTYAANIQEAEQQKKQHKRIILLENLRFFPGEKNGDITFTKQLASLGDFYVDDAFGTLARNDASLTLLPQYFDAMHKTIGLLVEHELYMLGKIKKQAKKPYYLIIGGGKIESKIPLIRDMLPHISSLFLGPAIVFSFLKAQGKKVGKSLISQDVINICKDIILQAEQLGVSVEYPLDYIIAEGSFTGPLELTDNATIPDGYAGISIGPKTAKAWGKKMAAAHTVVVNGLMGTIQRIESLKYVQVLFKALTQSDAYTVIAGGDSVAALYYFDLAQDIDYLSTGGSSTLSFLANSPLPALEALKNGTKT